MEEEVSSEKESAAGKDRREDAGYQRAVGEFVQREVIYGVSGLVFEIGKEKPDEWLHLFAQDDFETPAYDALLQFPRQQLEEFLEQHGFAINTEDTAETLARAFSQHLKDEDGLRDFCEGNHLEPQHTEIYEHWIVSEWLAAQLEQRGEVIERDFYGLTIWGRACTGQAILLDGVICSIYDELHKDDRRQTIADQNDRFRADFYIPSFGPRAVPGHIVCTGGIAALPPETQICIWAEVAKFSGFSEDNDPHGERDFGAFDMPGVEGKIFWKIDYYADKSCTTGSEDPADTARTFRVLTIMLASEW
jgi:hypothetical protein